MKTEFEIRRKRLYNLFVFIDFENKTSTMGFRSFFETIEIGKKINLEGNIYEVFKIEHNNYYNIKTFTLKKLY